jgi:hypothetical protein
MEEQTQIDPVYKKGFEHGYWLRKGESTELDGLIERSKHDGYKGGLQAGKKEADREQVRSRLQGNSGQENSRDTGMDVD